MIISRTTRVVELSLLATLLGYMWWAMDRTYPIDILNSTAYPYVVHPGENLSVRYTVNRRKLCNTKVERRIQNGFAANETIMPAIEFALVGKVGMDKFNLEVPLPETIAVGPAAYKSTVCYRCPYNAVQYFWPICRQLPPVHFTVTPAPEVIQ